MRMRWPREEGRGCRCSRFQERWRSQEEACRQNTSEVKQKYKQDLFYEEGKQLLFCASELFHGGL